MANTTAFKLPADETRYPLRSDKPVVGRRENQPSIHSEEDSNNGGAIALTITLPRARSEKFLNVSLN